MPVRPCEDARLHFRGKAHGEVGGIPQRNGGERVQAEGDSSAMQAIAPPTAANMSAHTAAAKKRGGSFKKPKKLRRFMVRSAAAR